MAIETVEFDLSMVNPETGRYNTARVYTIDGVNNVDGTPRELSIGQLVMAICLQRAAEMETEIIAMMDDMEATSALLEAMTKIETAVIEEFQANRDGHAYALSDKYVDGKSYETILRQIGILDSTQIYVRNDKVYSNADILYDDFISKLEAKMDEKNSFSQQTMIKLQSCTNKRDQSYDMVSNILKSLNTVPIGIVNNT